MDHRICPSCGENKPATLEYFRTEPRRRDGLDTYCRQCARIKDRENYIANKAKRIESQRQYRSRNEDRIRRRARIYRLTHRQQRREAEHRRRLDSPETASLRFRRREARQRGLEHTLTAAEYEDILERYGYACAYCGRSDVELEKEHIIPVAQGGGFTKDNIVPACKSCNLRKWAKTPEQAGMKLREPK